MDFCAQKVQKIWVKIQKVDPIPEGHAAEGASAHMEIDEIIVL
ncbi:hypothetical protein ACT3CD_14175 [Geofilum sp. OHC36d9]